MRARVDGCRCQRFSLPFSVCFLFLWLRPWLGLLRTTPLLELCDGGFVEGFFDRCRLGFIVNHYRSRHDSEASTSHVLELAGLRMVVPLAEPPLRFALDHKRPM